ncbi:2-pyrone-4,6-dicarbaxylate hydrolase [Pseudooceanicola marinus]|uniref:2-pyrone-4,6-dicarbaxylate hydrolase n=1 Tax=Pseudooceanicola marinus TaxID=396013 RepID=A0A1X6YSH7_9RHOB|nr:amidohydrolase family protein [Pseudooceanicola marinus]PJE26129.1 amidohydrolase [Pseudooceanicola marinus]SLN29877.1 2-pyrone-4,6-dicarbaxylate hydrolase [Pseudooceanicola marinus]
MISFDCHAHVYERVCAVPGARYVPGAPAPLETWLRMQSDHGLHGGVIVQVSFLGTDNSQLLDALSTLDRDRFAGIACVALDSPESVMRDLGEAGVRGVRWNLVSGAALPDPTDKTVQRFLDILRAHDMHVEVQLESARWADYLPALSRAPVPVVVDHMGLPASENAQGEPWLNALAACPTRAPFFVKLSAPYRGVPDARGHLDRLTALLPADRFVWGSDWPHTRFEQVASYAGRLEDLSVRFDDREASKTLYGISCT